METALAHMCQGLALYDSSGKLIFSNHRLTHLLPGPSDRLHAGIDMAEVMELMGLPRNRVKQLHRRLSTHREPDIPTRAVLQNSDGRLISIATQPIPEGGWVTTFEDVTEYQAAELKLELLARQDPLTGLANRAFLRRRLEEAVARMKRGIPFALLLLDIKDFSSINDALGETAGDELLKSIAQRLKKQVREIDTVARLDGDKFAILQCNPELPKNTEALASRLMECFRIPYQIGDQSIIAFVSLGIAIGGGDGNNPHELLKNADMALARAKQSLLPCYSFFNAEIDSHLKAQRELENDLYEASRRGEFSLHYQPIVNIQTGQIIGFETLLRWWHPTRGWVPPAEFVPVAEECGLIVSIGAWVLRTACLQAAAWPPNWYVAVNLSALQFQDGLLPTTVAQALALAGLDPHRLELEVTESVLLRDDEANLDILSQLREMGVRISLDDFGTGYSSLSYLRTFRFDKLKIDRSFVKDLPQSDSAKKIVKAITGLGQSFGICIVAEGVETRQQLEYLQRHGCDEVQGYLLGYPQPPEEILDAYLRTSDTKAVTE
ncbi:MAG TPA: EAL domain-containing protein [Terracidiphilus sp.]|nr:EAL domain-containing protein [Terracidiphilus sp.]